MNDKTTTQVIVGAVDERVSLISKIESALWEHQLAIASEMDKITELSKAQVQGQNFVDNARTVVQKIDVASGTIKSRLAQYRALKWAKNQADRKD